MSSLDLKSLPPTILVCCSNESDVLALPSLYPVVPVVETSSILDEVPAVALEEEDLTDVDTKLELDDPPVSLVLLVSEISIFSEISEPPVITRDFCIGISFRALTSFPPTILLFCISSDAPDILPDVDEFRSTPWEYSLL
uniref:Uncharacterized protein n=1 Tax=Cacopsylla melanoneura TaxID=428564 RepID=A0A8D8M864_9HEMI